MEKRRSNGVCSEVLLSADCVVCEFNGYITDRA